MTCSRCNAPCLPGSKFCQNCGAQFGPPPPTATLVKPTPKPLGILEKSIIGACLFGAFTIFMAYMFALGSEADKKNDAMVARSKTVELPSAKINLPDKNAKQMSPGYREIAGRVNTISVTYEATATGANKAYFIRYSFTNLTNKKIYQVDATMNIYVDGNIYQSIPYYAFVARNKNSGLNPGETGHVSTYVVTPDSFDDWLPPGKNVSISFDFKKVYNQPTKHM